MAQQKGGAGVTVEYNAENKASYIRRIVPSR